MADGSDKEVSLDVKAKNIKEDKSKKGKYEIQYDREGCIGAAACAAVSKNWVMNKDGKADLIKKYIDDPELRENIEAAKVCPVDVIKIIEKKTGKKIV